MLNVISRSISYQIYRFHLKSSAAISTVNEIHQKPSKSTINFKELKHPTKVPQQPHTNNLQESNEKIEIDEKTIQLLERLSLVNLDGQEAVQQLRDSIQFASKILNIDTVNVKPLYTVLENQQLELREDKITDGNIRDDIIRNAKVTEEEYFVAPPGNIPLKQD